MKIGQQVEVVSQNAYNEYTGIIDDIGQDGSFHIKGETSGLCCPVIKNKKVIVKERGLSLKFAKQCKVCRMYPFDIRYDSAYLFPIYHCPECDPKDFVKGWFRKMLHQLRLIG